VEKQSGEYGVWMRYVLVVDDEILEETLVMMTDASVTTTLNTLSTDTPTVLAGGNASSKKSDRMYSKGGQWYRWREVLL
jgi:hypothetical protein